MKSLLFLLVISTAFMESNSFAVSFDQVMKVVWTNPVVIGGGVEVSLAQGNEDGSVTYIMPRVRIENRPIWFALSSASNELCALLSRGEKPTLDLNSAEGTPELLHYSKLYDPDAGVLVNTEDRPALQMFRCR